jgi:hypothetical protein
MVRLRANSARRTGDVEVNTRLAFTTSGPARTGAVPGSTSKKARWWPDDAVGENRTQNQPGTIDEYPNWRVPPCGPDGRPILLEQVFNDSRATALAGIMHAQTAPSPSATC